MPKKTPKQPKTRAILVTLTKEPFQPVRLYYAIPDRAFVTKRLRQLQCMVDVPAERCWHWLADDEAADLPIPDGCKAELVNGQPILLGRLHLPREGGMTIQINSIGRAIAAARFFAPRLGPEVVAMRCRMVNRFFDGDEGPLPNLIKLLDPDGAERAAEVGVRNGIAKGKSAPRVEDFPLDPATETPEFRNLETMLKLRSILAMEHWKDNNPEGQMV